MPPEFTPTDLQEPYLSQVLGICRQELGQDYHSEADFRLCLQEDSGRYCQVVLDGRGAVCGFSLALLMGPQAAEQHLKLPPSPQRDDLLANQRIGYLDSGAVAAPWQKQGLGKLLISAACEQLRLAGAEVICAMAWKNIFGVTNARKVLMQNGLEESIAVPGYWNRVVASPEGHHCPVCGEPPCRCQGVLYLRRLGRG